MPEGNDTHDTESMVVAKKKLSEGRKELGEAIGYMNQIKTDVAEWQQDTKAFLEEVVDAYKNKAEELEHQGSNTAVSRVRAIWETLPALFRKEDPTKKRFGRVLNGLVSDAEKVYTGLDTELGRYEERFQEVDELTGKLIQDSKTYRTNLEEYNSRKTELEKQLSTLEEKLSEKKIKDQEYLGLRQGVLEKKRELEETRKIRSSLLNKYQQALNMLDAIEGFRDENQVMLSEGRNLHETLETNLNSLKPLFEQISSSADVVEFQRKALDAYDMLKKTFNPAMIAITAVAKGISKVATERMEEKFIEDDTIQAVRALTSAHKKELAERTLREDRLIAGIISQKEEPDTIVLEQDKDGTYKASGEDKAGEEGTEKKE